MRFREARRWTRFLFLPVAARCEAQALDRLAACDSPARVTSAPLRCVVGLCACGASAVWPRESHRAPLPARQQQWWPRDPSPHLVGPPPASIGTAAHRPSLAWPCWLLLISKQRRRRCPAKTAAPLAPIDARRRGGAFQHLGLGTNSKHPWAARRAVPICPQRHSMPGGSGRSPHVMHVWAALQS